MSVREILHRRAPAAPERTEVDVIKTLKEWDGTHRVTWIDAARGIGIALIVWGHAVRGSMEAELVPWPQTFEFLDFALYTFHVPLIFFLSGMTRSLGTRKNWGTRSREWLINLVWPYLLWSSILIIVQSGMVGSVNRSIDVSRIISIPWNPFSIFWFFYVLFIYRIIHQLFWGKIHYLLGLSFVGLVASWVTGVDELWQQVLAYLPYYAAGAALSRPELIPASILRHSLSTAVALGLFGAAVMLVYKAGFDDPRGTWATVPAVLGICAALGLAIHLRGRGAAIFQSLGQCSMVIYLTHVFFAAGTRILIERAFHVPASLLYPIAATLIGVVVPWCLALMFRRTRLAPIIGFGRRTSSIQVKT
ncbi:acyltransferase [Nostoc sp. NIES-2111]